VFGSIRIAATRQNITPPFFESMVTIGKVEVLKRMKATIDLLNPAACVDN
jgi:hypothetical protein